MSLINKMLQDLDRRHASQGSMAAPAQGLAQHVRPVSSQRMFSEYFWRVTAVLMLISVGWVGWLVWQLAPRSVVTDLAYESSKATGAPENAAAPALADGASPAQPAAPPVPASAPVVTALPADERPVPAASKAREGRANFDMLRLATELTTPIPERSARLSAMPAVPVRPAVAAPARRAAVRAEASPAVESGKIERRSNSTPVERAESEFRRAVNLVNQGRIAEGMDGLRTALKIDPAHEAARQTLVSLLLEDRRVDDAAGVLQEGLAVNADNTGFGMLLARIIVEHNDPAGALAVLQKHAAPPDRNPDFHAFAAALYQRLGRHPEAIDQYQQALRLAPSAGIWWVGLGISLQAAARPKEAFEAFSSAKAAGPLALDLKSFVDQRLKQLQ